MDKILFYVKIAAIIQIILIILFVITLYVTKLVLYFKEKNIVKTQIKIDSLLLKLAQNEIDLTLDNIKFFRRWIFLVLVRLNKYENNPETLPILNILIAKLKLTVLLPKAKKLYHSRNWFKRYIAVLCYIYCFDVTCEKQVLRLIADDILLVAINAATVAVRYNNSVLLNAMIDIFSKGRRVQQSINAELIERENIDISPILLQRLREEKDVAIKTFCYRLLLGISVKTQIYPQAFIDLNTPNLDLKIAVLRYIAQTNDPQREEILQHNAADSAWQIRAIVAKLLGSVNFQANETIDLLDTMLKDANWWVRINAANSLLRKGEKGVARLKAQSPQIDKFAYQTAVEVLSTHQEAINAESPSMTTIKKDQDAFF